jgi:uncharacterized protein YceH (UPF0502 family)
MRGRRSIGPEIADRAAGSALACTRLRVVLETLAHRKPVQVACAELGISEQRFERIRENAIQGAAAALELKPAGRPAKVPAPAEERIAALQDRIAELEAELQAATVRAELAATLPRLAESAGKKR